MNQNKNRIKPKIAALEEQLAAARRDLNTAWNARGCTDAVVLAAADRFDILCNRYQRLLLGPARRPKP